MKKLIEYAKEAAKLAYAPYSHFAVGAALESTSGRIFTGCNVENASYGLTNCAERTAIFKAISEGEQSFLRMAIWVDSDTLFTPCGACRQVISEFSQDMEIVIHSRKEELHTTIGELLPHSFSLHKDHD